MQELRSFLRKTGYFFMFRTLDLITGKIPNDCESDNYGLHRFFANLRRPRPKGRRSPRPAYKGSAGPWSKRRSAAAKTKDS